MSDAPNPSRSSDPLLTSARVLLAILVGLLVLAAVIVVIGTGAILTVQRTEVMAKVAAAGAPASTYGLVVLGFLLLVGLFLLTARFLLELRRIVDTVRDGDPFQAGNADRLTRMGWMAVGGQAIWLPLAGIARAIARYLDKGNGPDFNLAGGLLLILVLFILARVFRQGTEMRAELEGTV